MSVVLGIDLGTTTITALALHTQSGDILARVTTRNEAESTTAGDQARGRSEWDTRRMAKSACACLHEAADQVGANWANLAGLGITGQQHGLVIVDQALRPVTPFISWLDRRGEETVPGTDKTWVRQAADTLGPDAPLRTGCQLASGFLAISLYWMKSHGMLPPSGQACFVMDYFGALLTGTRPVTDPTCAASSGVFDIRLGSWAQDYLKALDLPPGLFPEVRPSGTLLGNLTEEAADMTGLPAGLPVFGGIGDNQASFLGSVGDPEETVLVNVGTGGQVSMFSEHFLYDPRLETRPYPGGGFLLACVGLCGGRAYAALEKFFRQVGWELYGMARVAPLFDTLNRLASSVPSGADGLRCEPFFAGTRQQPELRASWTGISLDNFAPAHLARSLLEGMARAFHSGEEVIAALTGRPARRLVGAGNGIRQNPLLAQLLADEFGLPLNVPCHAEEAAQGAALLAGFGAGLLGDLTTAGQLIRYTDPVVGERRS